jgi:hypothetical protein
VRYVEVTCIYCTSPLAFQLATALVGLLFDLAVVFMLQIFGRVKPLGCFPSYVFLWTCLSLLAIIDFTMVMKCFWLSCMGLCCPECCNCGFSSLNGKSMFCV